MAVDYRKQREDFQKLSFEDRREIVIGILASFRGQGDTFDTIYDYIVRGDGVTDQDLQDVHDSLMQTAMEVDKQVESQAIDRLASVRSRAIEMREREEAEKQLAQAEATVLMQGL